MKVIIGMSIVPTTMFIILFVELGILLTSFPQFVYAQAVENEIIEKALETVEKATKEGLSEITESVSNASESITMSADNAQELSNNTASSQAFQQIKNIATDMGNASKATDSTNTSDRFILQNQSKFKDSTRNWINGESDKLSFRYPSNWDVNVSDNRFDNYELIFTDKTSKSSIRVSDEAIETTNKIFLTANDPQGYFDIYMMQNSPLPSTAQKIETYPKGKVTIAGLQAYSELYIDNEYANLISLAFQKGNDRHYTVLSKSPLSQYDNLEPTMIEIIKSITPKTIQKPSDREVEILSNNTDSGDLVNNQTTELLTINNTKEEKKKQPSLMTTENTTESNILQKEKTSISAKEQNEDLTTEKLVNETIALENETTGIGERLGNLIDGNNNTASITNLSKSTAPNKTNYSTYEDKDIGFKINYPSNWEINTENSEYSTVASFKPLDVGIRVDVPFFPQGEYKSIKEYGDKTFKESDDNTLLAYYRNSTTTLGGQPALKAIYLTTYTPSIFESAMGYRSSTSKALMTATLVEPKESIFAIVYFAPPNLFSDSLPTIEQMIKSFQIQQSRPIIQEEDFSASRNSISIYSQNMTEEKKVELLSHKVKSGEYSDRFIGQVQNMIDKNVEDVEIIGTFYDNTGEIIGSKSTYTQPSDLKPTMKAPFEISLDEDIANEIGSYDVTITWRHPGESTEYSNVYELSQQIQQQQ